MSSPGSSVAALHGRDLCQRTVSYDERDAALYALAVGAAATELSLIYERDLRVRGRFGTRTLSVPTIPTRRFTFRSIWR